jgi:alginate O-acetyltransferase complex protein AlgI
LFLLLFSTCLDYYSGKKISETHNSKIKKIWFLSSIIINLSFLFIFKYYNFFIDSAETFLNNLGIKVNFLSLNIILPVGISFYTFHGLSYVIDIYKNKINTERSFINYAVFVSFFPLLVAGPIERASHLLPQLNIKREFSYSLSVDGLRQILWGLFKKIVIADQCAIYANEIFNNYSEYSGSTLFIGGVFFAFQIYGDFSGYSDIALGTAKLFGISLLKNFSFPYFSRDIAEFWRRWHISLSSWFRDYVYIPLGGNKGSMVSKIRNTFIVFLLSGFWHGANWTFIFWGILNALYFMPILISQKNRLHIEIVASHTKYPSISELYLMLKTFIFVVFAWILFRSESIIQAYHIYLKIFSSSLFEIPYFKRGTESFPLIIILLMFFYIEWIGRRTDFAISNFGLKWNNWLRYTFYYLLILSLFIFGGKDQQFIYFQF